MEEKQDVLWVMVPKGLKKANKMLETEEEERVMLMKKILECLIRAG